MGLDVHSKLVFGLPGRNVLRREDVTSKVTKYNPDNGTPYEMTLVSKEIVLFGVRFKASEFFPMEGSLERFNGQINSRELEIHELEMEFHCFGSDSYEDYEGGVFGFEIASLGGRSNSESSVLIVESDIELYRQAFKQATGLDGELRLMIHYSY
jgi:hypothetical protein